MVPWPALTLLVCERRSTPLCPSPNSPFGEVSVVFRMVPLIIFVAVLSQMHQPPPAPSLIMNALCKCMPPQEQGTPDRHHVQARAEEPTQLVVLSGFGLRWPLPFYRYCLPVVGRCCDACVSLSSCGRCLSKTVCVRHPCEPTLPVCLHYSVDISYFHCVTS